MWHYINVILRCATYFFPRYNMGRSITWTPYFMVCNLFFFLGQKWASPPLLTQNGESRHGCYPFKYEISNQHTKTAQTIQKEDDFREKCQNRQKSEEFRGAIKNQVVSEKSGWSGNAEYVSSTICSNLCNIYELRVFRSWFPKFIEK